MRVFILLLIFSLFYGTGWSCPEGADAIGQVFNRVQNGTPSPKPASANLPSQFDAGDVFKSADKIDDIKLNAEVMVKRGGDKGWLRGTYAGTDENGRLLVNFTDNGVGKTRPVLPENFQTNLKIFDESESLLQPGRQVFVARSGGGVSVGAVTKYDETGKMRVDFFDEASGTWKHKFVEQNKINDFVRPVTRQYNLKLKSGESVDVFSRTDGAFSNGVITKINENGSIDVLYQIKDGRNATKSIPANRVDDYLRPPKIASQKNIFRGSPAHSQNPDGIFMVPRKLPNGQKKQIMYNVGDREFAKMHGKLFEGVSPKDLPVGQKYTYIVKEDGSMVFGLVEDGWEFGVKHAHLANGDKVVAAGELSVKGPGNFTWNLESGSFTRKLVQSGKTSMEKLQGQMSKLFEGKMGSAGQYTDDILLNSDPPNPTNLKKLCDSQLFRMLNQGACQQLGI